jgi:YD repeat-containing protein
VTVRDEENRATTFTYQAFGHPDDRQLVHVRDAAQQDWYYRYTARGDLRRVLGPDQVTRTWTYSSAPFYRLTSETHPESGTVTYTGYDDAGVLKQRTDANGTTFVYGHDNNDRLTQITATPAGGSPQVTTITYEPGSDNRATTTGGGVSTTLQWDAAGRLWTRTDVVDGKSFQTQYDYYPNDDLWQITYPNGRLVRYDFDSQQRVTRVYSDTGFTYADGFSHHPSGALAGYTAGNGLITTLDYHPTRYWLASIQVGPPALQYALGYQHFPAGNVQQITDVRPGMNQSFTFDEVDRLKTANGFYGSMAPVYDAHGNRQDGYAYHASNPFRLRSIGGAFDLQYDNNGNLISGFGGTYQYLPENLMRESTVGGVTTQYAYDIDDWRVKRAAAGGPAYYFLRGPTGQLLTEGGNTSRTATVRDYIYAGSRLIAVVVGSADPK